MDKVRPKEENYLPKSLQLENDRIGAKLQTLTSSPELLPPETSLVNSITLSALEESGFKCLEVQQQPF